MKRDIIIATTAAAIAAATTAAIMQRPQVFALPTTVDVYRPLPLHTPAQLVLKNVEVAGYVGDTIIFNLSELEVKKMRLVAQLVARFQPQQPQRTAFP